MNDYNRDIPGTIPNEYREFLYISDGGNDNFESELFSKITRTHGKPIAKNGGVISENCKLWLPDNRLFHALSYKGDIEGWRKQIEQGVEMLGLTTGKVVNHSCIELTDGTMYELSDCKVEFY